MRGSKHSKDSGSSEASRNLPALFLAGLGRLLPPEAIPSRNLQYPKGAILLRQDEIPDKVLLLTRGLASSRMLLANGKEVLIAIHGPGVSLGDLEYFTRGTPAACEVRALEDCRCIGVDYPTMAAMLGITPGLGEAFAALLAARLYRSSRRMSTGITYPLEYNLLQALQASLYAQNEAGFEEASEDRFPGPHRLRKKDLAEYLGHSERHINRILNVLARKGIVRMDGALIQEVDRKRAALRLLELEE